MMTFKTTPRRRLRQYLSILSTSSTHISAAITKRKLHTSHELLNGVVSEFTVDIFDAIVETTTIAIEIAGRPGVVRLQGVGEMDVVLGDWAAAAVADGFVDNL